MTFPSIRLEGAILSADLLDSIERGDKNGQKARDFGFDPTAKVKDEISSTWATAKALWIAYQAKLSTLREGAAGTTETRNLFVIPLLTVLGYAPELTEAETLHGKSYAISHRDNTRDGLPIHIVGPFLSEPGTNPDRSSLDVRVKGVHRLSPHALVQEYLNLTEHLYGIVTNGHKFRLLRDSSRLIKLSFLEFDFERIFGEELFADFALFYRLLHASRMPANRNEAAQSIIELYHQDALDSGSAIRRGLAAVVAFAMQTIATGLLAHPENEDLRTEVKTDPSHASLLHQNLLRWVYRTLFLLVIEERGLHHNPGATLRQRQIYRDYYSLQRLRHLADRPQLANSRDADLWRAMHQTLRLYEEGGKGRPLGVEPLGSFLFREEGLQPLFQYQLDNRTLLTALHRLSIFKHPDTGNLMRVNYGALDVEEFGSIYESLLELRPRIVPGNKNPTFNYVQLAGNERKTTGSYYTPDSLVQQLISTALDPVLEEHLRSAGLPPTSSTDERRQAQEKALLSFKVCDPAVGSGHFLIAAAHRLSRRLAEIRAGDEALSIEVRRHALRDVVSHCLYGVDINPLSVELCKVSLWMLGMEPGKPLSFLDHHIQCGNALIGATAEALAKGLPDAAFKPIQDDDSEYCKKFKAANNEEAKLRKQVGDLFDRDNKPWERLGNVPAAIAKIETLPDDTPEAVRTKAETYENAVRSADYLNARFLHDAWCAAFVWKKSPPKDGGFEYPITNGELTKIERNPYNCPPWMREETQRLAEQYKFFHWHLAFPEVFGADDRGFDVILGNPPWEMPEVDDREFFNSRRPSISEENSAKTRATMICSLAESDPALFAEWNSHLRLHQAQRAFISGSGCYPNGGSGRLNLFRIFLELGTLAYNKEGSLGMVIPSGLATNAYERPLWLWLLATRRVDSAFDFENREKLFPNVDSRAKFTLITLGSNKQSFRASCWLTSVPNLSEPGRQSQLTTNELREWSGEDLSLPQFRTSADLALIKAAYSRHQPFKDQEEWRYTPRLMFSSSDAAFATVNNEEFRDISPLSGNRKWRKGDEHVPVYEGKMVGILDHRQADILINPQNRSRQAQEIEIPSEDKTDPSRYATPQHWIQTSNVRKRRFAKNQGDWELVVCDVTSATNERTTLSCIVPLSGLTRSLHAIYFNSANPIDALAAVGYFSTFSSDYLARLKVSGNHLTQGILGTLPFPTRKQFNAMGRAHAINTIELTYTAWDLEPFAVDCGYDGPPFRWDEERRFQLRCELDALFFHLYLPCDDSGAWKPARVAEGAARDETDAELAALKSHFPTPRDAVAYIMDTFPTVRKTDIKVTTQTDEQGNVIKKGTYRTKHRILDLYDQMLHIRRAGKQWISPLDPPPGPPAADDGTFLAFEHWKDAIPPHIHFPKLTEDQIVSVETTSQTSATPLRPVGIRPRPGTDFYFLMLIPHLARLSPEGIPVSMLLSALDLFCDTGIRRGAVSASKDPDAPTWAKDHQQSTNFDSAGGALLSLLDDQTLVPRGGRLHLSDPAKAVTSDWLAYDAHYALLLARLLPSVAAPALQEKFVAKDARLHRLFELVA